MSRMKIIRSKKAVSEVLGTFILLTMAISLFSLVNFLVLTYPFNEPTPSVNLIGSIENNEIRIKHNYGDSLVDTTKIIIIIDDARYDQTVGDFLDASEISGGWNIGETIEIDPSDPADLDPPVTVDADSKIKVMVVDENSNSIIMMADLQ